jgi:AcrR family transcriptional regulator
LAQKMEEIEDLRVRRTRKLLQEALIELTVEKGFAAVTVRDITERAMVNRSTFYRHYLDKYALLDEYMNDVDSFSADEGDDAANWSQPVSDTPPGLVHRLKHVQKYGEFYRVMLGQNGDAAFTAKFRQGTEKRFRYLLANYAADNDANAPPVDMKLTYISCAAVGAILWWLESGQPCTVEQLATWLSKLTTASAGLSFKPT